MGLYLNSLLSTTIFFFALPLGEMCMHFRVFRSAWAPFSTHERGMHMHFGVSRRPRGTVLLHSPAPQYEAHFSGVFRSASAPFPLLSEECMCILECRAGRRAERQGFFNRKIPDFKMHMHSERRTTPFPLRQCHHNSTMRRHEPR